VPQWRRGKERRGKTKEERVGERGAAEARKERPAYGGNLNRFLSILKPSAYCKLKINSTAGNGNEEEEVGKGGNVGKEAGKAG